MTVGGGWWPLGRPVYVVVSVGTGDLATSRRPVDAMGVLLFVFMWASVPGGDTGGQTCARFVFLVVLCCCRWLVRLSLSMCGGTPLRMSVTARHCCVR